MALFGKKGDNITRATSILQKHGMSGEEKTEEELAQEAAAAQEAEAAQVAKQAQEAAEASTKEAEEQAAQEAAAKAAADEGKTEEELAEEKKQEELAAEAAAAEANKDKPEVLTEEAIFSFLSEKLNRKVESVDDLTPKEIEIDPELKQLAEWKEKTGLSLSKWSDYNKDYSQVGDLDIAREILSQNHPNFTKEELEYKLSNFVYDEDEDGESERLEKSIKLKEFAQKGRLEFEAKRLELKPSGDTQTLTKEQIESLTFADQARDRMQTTSDNEKVYEEKLHEASLALNSLDLKLGDDLTIKYEVPEGSKKTLTKSILEMPHWYNNDGSINHNNVALDGVKVRDFDSIMDAVLKQGIAIGREEIIEGKPNTKIGVDGLPQTGGTPKTGNISEVVSKITGSGSKLRFGKPKN
tara:strand:+ start:36533 stop:37765 length:1233 start_codon:yes stop_codon:yes gene_type:complete